MLVENVSGEDSDLVPPRHEARRVFEHHSRWPAVRPRRGEVRGHLEDLHAAASRSTSFRYRASTTSDQPLARRTRGHGHPSPRGRAPRRTHRESPLRAAPGDPAGADSARRPRRRSSRFAVGIRGDDDRPGGGEDPVDATRDDEPGETLRESDVVEVRGSERLRSAPRAVDTGGTRPCPLPRARASSAISACVAPKPTTGTARSSRSRRRLSRERGSRGSARARHCPSAHRERVSRPFSRDHSFSRGPGVMLWCPPSSGSPLRAPAALLSGSTALASAPRSRRCGRRAGGRQPPGSAAPRRASDS